MNLTKILCKDELHPAMMRAVITNGYIYATNAHIGIRIKLNTVPNFHVNTDNKVLNKFQLSIIAKAKEVWFEDDYFKVKGNTVNGKFFYDGYYKEGKLYCDDLNGFSWPDLESVIQGEIERKQHELPFIGINPDILKILSDSFIYDGHAKHLKLSFGQNNRAILVEASAVHHIEQIGIIMPVILNH